MTEEEFDNIYIFNDWKAPLSKYIEEVQDIVTKLRMYTNVWCFNPHFIRFIRGEVEYTDSREVYDSWEQDEFPTILVFIEDYRSLPYNSLKPFDKVLVRNDSEEDWELGFFEAYFEDKLLPHKVVGGKFYKECKPYVPR